MMLEHPSASGAEMVKGSNDLAKQLAETGKRTPLQDARNPFGREVTFPSFNISVSRPPSPEEQNQYQSAGTLMRRLAETITDWRKQLPEGVQPALMAIVQGGPQIKIQSLAQEGFNGIRIDGFIGDSPCILLAHQATVQILCYIEEIEPPDKPKRSIGFIIEGEETQA